jgi:hypothetical protein
MVTDGKRRIVMRSKIVICALIGILFLCSSGLAESRSSEKWEYKITPYGWLAGQKGTVATLPGFPPADIDVGFLDDIAGNINGSMSVKTELRKGHWGAMADISYSDIEDETATANTILWQTVSSRTKSWIVSLAGQYRLFEYPGTFMDAIGGIRYWSVDSRLALRGGPAQDREISHKEDWFDPILGLRDQSFLGNSKFFLSGELFIGGFGIGSDFMWDACVNLGYQMTESVDITLGYRYMDVDYEKGEFLYDVSQDGMIMSLGWQF